MIQVSKNYKLGKLINDLKKIHELANLGRSCAYRYNWGLVKNYNVKPCAIIQNWTLKTLVGYSFFEIERIEP